MKIEIDINITDITLGTSAGRIQTNQEFNTAKNLDSAQAGELLGLISTVVSEYLKQKYSPVK